MDSKKKSFLLLWIGKVWGKPISSISELHDGCFFLHVMRAVSHWSEQVGDLDDSDTQSRILTVKKFLQDFYGTEDFNGVLNFDGILSDETRKREMELAKVAVVLLGVALIDKQGGEVVQKASMELPDHMHADVVSLLEAVVQMNNGPKFILSSRIEEALQTPSDEQGDIALASWFQMPKFECNSNNVSNVSLPEESPSTSPLAKMSTPLAQCRKGSVDTPHNTSFGISSPFKDLNINSVSPFVAYIQSPQLIRKAILKEKELELRQLKVRLNEEMLLKEDVQLSLRDQMEEITRKDSEINELKNRIKELQYLQDAQDELQELKPRQAELQAKCDKFASRQQKLDQYKSECRMLEKETAGQRDEIQSLHQEIQSLKSQNQEKSELLVSKNCLEKQMGLVKAQLEEASRVKALMEEELMSVRSNLHLTEEKYRDLKRQTEDCQEESFQGESMGVVTDIQLGEMKSQVDRLSLERTDLQTKVNSLNATVDEQNSFLEEMKKQIESSQQMNESLVAQLRGKCSEIEGLKFDIDERETNHKNALMAAKTKHENNLNVLRTDNEKKVLVLVEGHELAIKRLQTATEKVALEKDSVLQEMKELGEKMKVLREKHSKEMDALRLEGERQLACEKTKFEQEAVDLVQQSELSKLEMIAQHEQQVKDCQIIGEQKLLLQKEEQEIHLMKVRDELLSDMRTEKSRFESQIGDLQSMYEQGLREKEALEADLVDLRNEMVAKLESENVKREEEIMKLKDEQKMEMVSVQAKHEQEMSQLHKDAESRSETFVEELSQLKKENSASAERLQKEHENSMFELNEKLASTMQQYEKEFGDAQNRIQMLEGRNANLEDDLVKFKETAAVASEEHAKHASEMYSLQQEYSEKVSRMEQEHSEKVSHMEQGHSEMVSRMGQEHSEKVSRMEQEHSEKVSHMEQEHSEKVSHMEQEHSEMVSLMEQEHSEKVSHMEQGHSEKVSRMEQEHSEKVSHMEQGHSEMVSRMGQEHSEKVSHMEQEHSEKVSHMEQGHSEMVSLMEQVHSEKVSHMEQEHSEKVSRMEQEHSEKASCMEQEYSEKVSRMEQEHNEKVSSTEQKHSEKMSSMEQECSEKVSHMEQIHNKEVSRMEQEHIEKVSHIEQEHNEKVSSMEQEYSEKVSNMEQGYNEKVSNMEQVYSEKVSNMIKERNEMEQKHVEKMNRIEQEHTEKFICMEQDYIQKVSQMEQETVSRMQQKQSEIVSSLEKEHIEKVSRIEQEYAEKLSSTEQEHSEKLSSMEQEHSEKLSTMEQEHSEKLSSMEQEHSHMAEQLESQGHEALVKQKNEFEAMINDLQDGMTKVTSHKVAVDEELSTLLIKHDELTAQLSDYQKYISETVSEKEALEARLKNVEGDYTGVMAIKAELEERVISLSAENLDVKSKAEEAQSQFGQFEEGMGVQFRTVQEQVVKLQEENDEISSQKLSVEKEVAQLQEKLAVVVSEKSSLENELATAQLEKTDIVCQKTLIEEELLCLRQENTDVLSQKNSLEEKVVGLQLEISKITSLKESVEGNLLCKENDFAALKSENVSVQEKVLELEEEMSLSLKAMTDNHSQAMSRLQGEHDEKIETMVTIHHTEIARVEEEKEKLMNEISVLRNNLDSTLAEVRQVEMVMKENENLATDFQKETLEKLEVEREEHEKLVAKIRSEADERLAIEKADVEEMVVARMNEEMERKALLMKNECDELNIKLQETEGALTCQKEEYEKVVAEIMEEARNKMADFEKEMADKIALEVNEKEKLAAELSEERISQEALVVKLREEASEAVRNEQQQVAKLMEDVRAIEEEKSVLAGKISILTEETNKMMQIQKGEHSNEMQRVQECNEAKMEEVTAECRKEVEAAREEVKEVTSRYQGQLEEEVARVRQEAEISYEAILDGLKRQFEVAKETEMKALSDQKADLSALKEKFEEELQSQQTKMDQRIKDLQEENQKLRERESAMLKNMESQMSKANEFCHHLQQQLEAAKKEGNSASRERIKLYEKQKETNVSLNKALQVEKENSGKMQQRLESHMAKHDKTKALLVNAQKEARVYAIENNRLKTSLDFSERQLRNYKNQLEQAGNALLGSDAHFKRTLEERDSMEDSLDAADTSVMSSYSLRSTTSASSGRSTGSAKSGSSSPNETIISADSVMMRRETLAGSSDLRKKAPPIGFKANMLSCDNEPEEFEWDRLSELKRRNTLCLPHMKSSYAVETQAKKEAGSDEQAVRLSMMPGDVPNMPIKPVKRRSPRLSMINPDEDDKSTCPNKKGKEETSGGTTIYFPLARDGAVYQPPGTLPNRAMEKQKLIASGTARKKLTPSKLTKSPGKLVTRGRSFKSPGIKGRSPAQPRNAVDENKASVAFSIGFTPKKAGVGRSRLAHKKPGNQEMSNLAETKLRNSPRQKVRKPLATRNYRETGI